MSLFLAIEGGDCTGKTTFLSMLETTLLALDKRYAIATYYNNDAGKKAMKMANVVSDTDKAIKIRLLVESVQWNISNIILPALNKEHVVIYDRCFLSTMIYQGVIENIGLEGIRYSYTNMFKNRGVPLPHLVLLDVDGVTQEQRLRSKKNKDSYELMDMSFHNYVRELYLKYAADFPSHEVIDNSTGLTEKEVKDWLVNQHDL